MSTRSSALGAVRAGLDYLGMEHSENPVPERELRSALQALLRNLGR
ncbi:hypothetical protein [Streptomyces rubiginosohelvolus]